MIRRPVTSAVLGSILLVVCDDGSVWELDPGDRWVERLPVPGTCADVNLGDERRAEWRAGRTRLSESSTESDRGSGERRIRERRASIS